MPTIRAASTIWSHLTPRDCICTNNFTRLVSSRGVLHNAGRIRLLSTNVTKPRSPFYFETGYALFAKRPSRPFPPPFVSLPSGSFSDPLSTHNRSIDRRPFVNGQAIRGVTNGDDAIIAGESFIAAGDGVGQWATRERGHAALWSRLILHFWDLDVEQALRRINKEDGLQELNPVEALQKAFEHTKAATSAPNEWYGTTTACGALLHCLPQQKAASPTLYVTNLGDSQCLVLRPTNEAENAVLYKTVEQWHWFDCPRQLGTNSPDSPTANAAIQRIKIQEGDVVLVMSDGVIDNLWEHEIIETVVNSLKTCEKEISETNRRSKKDGGAGVMKFLAEELLKATRAIAEDPYAESPFMERAIEEGLALEGGKVDDISIVAAMCRKRPDN